MANDELRVRQLAYRIWESEGRPEGQQQRHWDMALKIVAAEQAAGREAFLEDEGEAREEAPILEDDLPLEEDEKGIEEDRLPLEDPDGDPTLDEAPYRDDVILEEDLPVHDRAGSSDEALESAHALEVEDEEEGVEIRRVPRKPSTKAKQEAPNKQEAPKKEREPAAKKTVAEKTKTSKAAENKAKKTTSRSAKPAGKKAPRSTPSRKPRS